MIIFAGSEDLSVSICVHLRLLIAVARGGEVCACEHTSYGNCGEFGTLLSTERKATMGARVATADGLRCTQIM